MIKINGNEDAMQNLLMFYTSFIFLNFCGGSKRARYFPKVLIAQ